MISEFDTNVSSTQGGSGSGMSTKTIVTIVLVVGIAYLGYRFVLKPMLDKRKEQQEDEYDD